MAGGYRHHIRKICRNVCLPGLIVAPSHHGPVVLKSDAKIIATRDCDHVAEVSGHICRSIQRCSPGGDRAIGAVEIAPRDGFYDYANKYIRGATDYYVPPRVSPERYRGLLTQALRAHLALGCSGATRVDMMLSEAGNEFILEVNTLPGLTPTSLLPKIADAAGISFGELCEMMLAGAALASRRGRGERRIAQRAFVGDDRWRAPVAEPPCEHPEA